MITQNKAHGLKYTKKRVVHKLNLITAPMAIITMTLIIPANMH